MPVDSPRELDERPRGAASLRWPFGAALLATALVCARGVPVLRHDWDWPLHRDEAYWWWLDRTSGWRLGDFGQPDAYPTLYLAGACKALLVAMFGPLLACALYVFATSVVLGLAASRYAARDRGRTRAAAPLAIVLAIFNPWTYTQFTAGHLEMLWGLAGVLVAFVGVRERRAAFVGVGAVAALAQIQFFLIVCACAAFFLARRRRIEPALFCAVLFLPIAYAAWSESGALARIPFLLAWQKVQHVDFLSALALSGYAARYADGTEAFVATALACVAFARVDAVRALPRRARVLFCLALVALLAIVGGPQGPVGGIYGWAVAHVRVLAVYRELYDLVGLVVVAYLSLVALPPAPRRRAADAIAALSLVLAWLWLPPYRYFPAAPPPSVLRGAPPATGRFALLPAFQPLRYEGRGGGIDPDAVARGLSAAPLNAYLSTYPADAALARFAIDGNTGPLARLGVSRVVVRCRFETAADGILQVRPAERAACVDETRAIADAAPFVRTRANPGLAVLDQALNGNVFGGDAGLDIRGLRGATTGERAEADWIDARLRFTRLPEIAQGYGGVFTASRATLRLAHRPWMLMWARGRILSASTDSGELRGRFVWRRVPVGDTAFACRGECLLAADAPRPISPLEAPPTATRAAIAASCRLPGWCTAIVDPRGDARAIVELNTRFDAGWRARSDGAWLPHAPLDGVSNGFRLPAGGGRREIAFVHVPSFVEYALELVALSAALTQAVRNRRIIKELV